MTETVTKPRTRVQWSATERAEWLAMFEKSGQSVSEFCRANDLPPATLSLWRSQQSGGATGAGPDGIVEIPAAAVEAHVNATAAVTMQLPGGVRLEIAAGTDPLWLARLARALVPVKS